MRRWAPPSAASRLAQLAGWVHSAHISPPAVVQSAPVAAIPFSHVHSFCTQYPSIIVNPSLSHDPQIFSSVPVQSSPSTAVPLSHTQTFADCSEQWRAYSQIDGAAASCRLAVPFLPQHLDPIASLFINPLMPSPPSLLPGTITSTIPISRLSWTNVTSSQGKV